jgi:hypothetical protein
MPSASGGVHWHGRWAPEHPVQYRTRGSTLPLYLSLEDAAHRIRTAYAHDKPEAARLMEALKSGRSVHGYRLLQEEPE